MQVKIAPSVLSADFSRLAEEIRAVEAAGADMIHVDVMDGRFVPNITIGPVVVESIRKVTKLPLDVHLMIVEPEKYIADFCAAGANIVGVHVEATAHLHRCIEHIHLQGVKACAVANPATPLSMLEDILPFVDQVLLMSVNPGFGGQKFIATTIDRCERLKAMLHARKLNNVDIEIDGGINTHTAPRIVEVGANVLVAGHAIFRAKDYSQAISELKASAIGLPRQ